MSSPTEPDLSQLRAILVLHRAASGLTVEELAEKSGLTRGTLLNISSGRYRGDLRSWLLLARAFGISLDELLAPVWEGEKS